MNGRTEAKAGLLDPRGAEPRLVPGQGTQVAGIAAMAHRSYVLRTDPLVCRQRCGGYTRRLAGSMGVTPFRHRVAEMMTQGMIALEGALEYRRILFACQLQALLPKSPVFPPGTIPVDHPAVARQRRGSEECCSVRTVCGKCGRTRRHYSSGMLERWCGDLCRSCHLGAL